MQSDRPSPSSPEWRQYVLDAERGSDLGSYAGMLRRCVRAYGRRVAETDPDDLTLMLILRAELDVAIDLAVQGQRANGFSWGQIARPLRMTRQAVQQRWGA